MKLGELKSTLAAHPEKAPRFVLPDGDYVPAHFHVTEVGHVTKNFIDCGGTIRKSETCVLQTFAADDVDHRLTADRLGAIVELGKNLLPHENLEVEVEYDCCVISQYPIKASEVSGEHLDFHLASKHTDCLAQELCGIGPDIGDCTSTGCC